jgi:hypothetical protein
LSNIYDIFLVYSNKSLIFEIVIFIIIIYIIDKPSWRHYTFKMIAPVTLQEEVST